MLKSNSNSERELLDLCSLVFLAFFSFFNKIQDGHQNPMSLTRAWTASCICIMLGWKEESYPGHVLIMIIKMYIFFTFCDFSWYFSFAHFGYYQNLVINIVIQLKCYLLGILTGPEKIVRRTVFLFSFFLTKFKMDDESHVTLKSLNCFTDLFQGSNLPWTYVAYILVWFWHHIFTWFT